MRSKKVAGLLCVALMTGMLAGCGQQPASEGANEPEAVVGVPVETIPNARFQFDGMMSQLDQNTGHKLTIGQKMTVRVVSSDVASGKIDFAYEGQWPPKNMEK